MIRPMFSSLGRVMWNLFGGRKPLPTSVALMTGAVEDRLAPESEAREQMLRRAMTAASEPEVLAPAVEAVAAATEEIPGPESEIPPVELSDDGEDREVEPAAAAAVDEIPEDPIQLPDAVAAETEFLEELPAEDMAAAKASKPKKAAGKKTAKKKSTKKHAASKSKVADADETPAGDTGDDDAVEAVSTPVETTMESPAP